MKNSRLTKGHICSAHFQKGHLIDSQTTCQLYSRQKYLTEVTTTRERSLVRHEDETILKDKEGNEPIYAEEN